MHAELLFPRFMAANRDDAIGLRSKCKHFRVLVMGRANAGKTTLLKKVCNSVKDPEIFSPTGTEIHVSTVEGSDERGLHDIENQLIFKSNRQFIFHDSCGFESGSVVETEKVEAFIAQRAKSETLSEQLHAIWYCLPTDTNRPLLAADEKFFNTHDTRKVPVIAIFTKFDGLIIKAFTKLLGDELTQMMLATNFKGPLKKVQFPPSAYVRLDDMRQETSNCIELIGKTASTLTDDTLRLLLVSVQQNNINLCCESAVKDGLGSRDLEDIYRCKDIEGFHTFAPGVMRHTLAYFPHVWVTTFRSPLQLLC
ncbi:hypothetical protein B0H14DRAFT_2675930 [Mycena olivaceomarginata]|nr:hypothetical protein B0H14DRAFT_2675930 [Mycena olivaceomarginata]